VRICAAVACCSFTFALPFGGRSGFLLTAQEPKKIAGPGRIQFGVCFKVRKLSKTLQNRYITEPSSVTSAGGAGGRFCDS